MPSKNKSDLALALFKAGVSAVPVVGGSIASLVGDYIPSATEKSKNRAIELLEKRLKELEGRLDPSNVNKDQFAELFKSSYLSIVRSHNDAKLRAATNLIANILLEKGDIEKLSYTELDHFARCVENLSSGAIEVLSVAVRMAKKDRKVVLETSDFRMNFSELKAMFSNMTPSLLMGLIGELDSANLLHRKGTPTITAGEYSNYPIELTLLGVRFVKHILGDDT
ncbi:MAG: hypothetical protein BA863_04775 [Desulfovibrio sp. S3730MH75]|nr:MAG: hypothetical protein BA863_04775 [Desulfovibrio sp. S3730MH75]